MDEEKVTILVIDHEGSGFNVLWTTDGELWLAYSRRPFNRALLDRVMVRKREQFPGAVVRKVKDFYGRIPEDLVTARTRVI